MTETEDTIDLGDTVARVQEELKRLDHESEQPCNTCDTSCTNMAQCRRYQVWYRK